MKVIDVLRRIPKAWWVPQGDRAALALFSLVFWGGVITQAWQRGAEGASVFAFFGLGLVYLLFSMFNVFDALKKASGSHDKDPNGERQIRALVQLFVVLGGIFFLNTIVLSIYLVKGTSFTSLDVACLAIDTVLIGILALRYGFRTLHRHPMARGWIAIAGKTIPQLSLGVIFIIEPTAVNAFTLLSIASLAVLAALRLVPTVRVFRRDKASPHLRGLLLGEAGNTLSVGVVALTWSITTVVTGGS